MADEDIIYIDGSGRKDPDPVKNTLTLAAGSISSLTGLKVNLKFAGNQGETGFLSGADPTLPLQIPQQITAALDGYQIMSWMHSLGGYKINVLGDFYPDTPNVPAWNLNLGLTDRRWPNAYIETVNLGLGFGVHGEIIAIKNMNGNLQIGWDMNTDDKLFFRLSSDGAGSHMTKIYTSGEGTGFHTNIENNNTEDSNKALNLKFSPQNKTAGTGDGGDLILKAGTSSGGSSGVVLLSGKVAVDSAASASSSVGSLAKKIEIFDANGSSLGFIPVYSSIT